MTGKERAGRLPGIAAAAALAAGLLAATPAPAQTLNIMRGTDAPTYDAHRTTWSPAADIINMVQDTLTALDWDGKTPLPYLAKSWDISPDGKTYTFKLRDDVTFCSGKKLTADDVVFTITRLRDPATKGPYAWRAGEVTSIKALDAHTVAYELKQPFSDLLLQLTMFTNVIMNKENVEALGKDYGSKGLDGTGPWCFVSWQPRTEILLRRNDAYKWGPSMFKNPGPVRFDRMSIKIIPEESSRVAAMMAGRFDLTGAFPTSFIPQARANPNLLVQKAEPNFQLLYYGFKTTRPLVADRRVREAMNIAINRAQIAKGVLLGNADPAFTYVDPAALDFLPRTANIIKEDVARANALLDEAGWKMGADGIREKDGEKLAPVVYVSANTNSSKVAEAIQGFLRKIGVDWRIQAWDSTIAPLKMAGQDYELWSVTVPYMTAGDLMSLYFDSRNIPTPNRMNWNDNDTDRWLRQGNTALTPEDRALNFGRVQERVTKEHLWIPVLNVDMYMTTNKRLKNARPHMLYQNVFYKGLDLSF
jgi:peptide/nickel transport system substrate-binding protein